MTQGRWVSSDPQPRRPVYVSNYTYQLFQVEFCALKHFTVAWLRKISVLLVVSQSLLTATQDPNLAACSTLEAFIPTCSVLIPGFETITNTISRVACFYYNQDTWNPNLYDRYYGSCVNYISRCHLLSHHHSFFYTLVQLLYLHLNLLSWLKPPLTSTMMLKLIYSTLI